MAQKLKAKGKTVIQNTKNGAVEKNLADGTAVKISGRASDFSLKRADMPDTQKIISGRSRSLAAEPEKAKRRRYSGENLKRDNEGNFAGNRTEGETDKNDFLNREQRFERNDETPDSGNAKLSYHKRRRKIEVPSDPQSADSNDFLSREQRFEESHSDFWRNDETPDSGSAKLRYHKRRRKIEVPSNPQNTDSNDFLSREQRYEESHTDFWRTDEAPATPLTRRRLNDKTQDSVSSYQTAENEYAVSDGSDTINIVTDIKTEFDISARRKRRRKAESFKDIPDNTDVNPASFQNTADYTPDSGENGNLEYVKNGGESVNSANPDIEKAAPETVIPLKRRYRLKKTSRHSYKLKERKSKTLSDKPSEENPAPQDSKEKYKKLQKRSQRLEQKRQYAAEKLSEAEKKLPQKRVLKFERDFDGDKGKRVTKLVFEKEVKPLNKKDGFIKSGVKKGSAAIGGAAALSFHREIRKYEDDNSALKAAHGAERAAEKAARSAVSLTKSANQAIKEKPYAKVSKLKEKSVRLESRKSRIDNKIEYKKALDKKRRRIQAKKAGKNTAETMTKTKEIAVKAARKIQQIIAANSKVIIILLAALLLITVLSSLAGSVAMMLAQGLGGELAASYLSEDEDILSAEDFLAGLESELQGDMSNIQTEYPGYDEYRIDAGETGHDPYALISYLSAKYPAFEMDGDAEAAIQELFNSLYTVQTKSITEQRTETYTEYDERGNPYEVTYVYDYRILEATLIQNDFDEAVKNLLNDDEYELYQILMETKGGREDLF